MSANQRDEVWAASERKLGCPSCRRGDCGRHQVDFSIEDVVLRCLHDCSPFQRERGRRYKVGDEIVSVAGMKGTVVRDVTEGQRRPAYRVHWDNGTESIARPGFVIAGLDGEVGP